MYRILFLLVTSALFCNACTGNREQKNKLTEELRLFKELPISLPDNMLVMGYHGHSADSSLLSRPYKMVIYINEEGCTGCKLQTLMQIQVYILEHKHLENFGVIVILHTSQIEVAERFIYAFRFSQTVFYDLDGSFERLNMHLPKDERFHTFLLDKENKVVLVGDPTRNTKLKKLYETQLSNI